MQNKRQAIAKVWHKLGGAWLWQCLPQKRLTIIGMHRIGDRRQIAACGLDPSLVDMTRDDFQSFIRWLSIHTNPISTTQLEHFVSTGKPLPPRATLLTFDDGYSDNLDAAEIMAHYNVPGLFFITPGLTSVRQLGWWEQLHYGLKNTSLRDITFMGEHFFLPEEHFALYQKAVAFMKLQPRDESAPVFEALLNTLGASIPDQLADQQLMTQKDLRYLSQTLCMQIGSHAMTHRVLSTLPVEDQVRELSEAKTILEGWTEQEVNVLAYPVGGEQHFTEGTKAAARRSGYKIGMTLIPGVVPEHLMDPFELPRISCQGHWQLDTANIAHPKLFNQRSHHAS